MVNGHMHGNGRYHNGAGLTYSGAMADGKRHGEGTETRPDGSTYSGQWSLGTRSGSGRETAADGSFHDGEWEFNQPHGPGQRQLENGIQITGTFAGELATNGLLVLPSGPAFAGPLWTSDGKMHQRLVEWIALHAAQGDPYAQLLDAQGRFAPGTDTSMAKDVLEHLESAEAAGIGDAAFLLATYISDSDRERAVQILRRAAARPHAPSARLLGELLLKRCQPQTPCHTEALGHLQTAAQRGDRQAARHLSEALLQSDASAARAVIHNLAVTFGEWQDLNLLAAVHAAEGDTAAALRVATRALQQAQQSDKTITTGDLERLTRQVEIFKTKLSTEAAP
jgi:hypothetical protein